MSMESAQLSLPEDFFGDRMSKSVYIFSEHVKAKIRCSSISYI